MQIIRTILIILLVYYGFKFVFRVVMPFFLTRWVNKKTQQFQQQNHFTDAEKAKEFAKQKEGEVKIKTTKTNKPETDGIGDYVDYEDVKDD